ncbi:capsular biosynthesis protein [Sporosarcina sp. Marseille-Q4063]|uniref:tyrosine-protein phosphatase n=1 Tax=Sporosarcina sp. Marseille-Q4063 TaxID=2810514 RepID=UPI001BAE7C61|nr:CpsB/CapC family capsule biosynthesis tyrosine phosphatase [Sporosarcina sp. Marseille-Q4063]QUW21245.1 capsular biosynthesis protein [Sporosarcina sp. Marseille-Q4063]
MVDIHSHILPGVDDGPKTIEESVQLLEMAVAEGITDIIATPHAYSPHFDVPKEAVLQKVTMLNEISKEKGLSIIVHAGQELRIKDFIVDKLITEEALTLAGSKYVLLELPSSGIPTYTVDIIQNILSMDRVPIIAHPERNRAIAQKPERLARLINHGALAQITAGSLAGHFGKQVQNLSLRLVEANLIHTYGSDVHNPVNRPFHFEKGLNFLDKRKLHDIADILLENNDRILTNEDFILLEPNALEPKKWWKLLS